MLELNKIYNIDCIDGMKQIDDKSIDMIFVDLPHEVTANNQWDIVIPFNLMWEQFERIIKDNGAILLFAQGLFSAKLILSNEKLYRYDIIWEKTTPTGFLNANRMPLRSHEQILVFYKNLPTYSPQKTTGHERKVSKAEHKVSCIETTDYGKYNLTTYDSTERYPTSVWTFSTDKQNCSIHPTQKPIDLCRYAIRTYTNVNDIVLDCCCGSGSIPLAAKMEQRNYIGMDNGICIKPNTEYHNKPYAEIAQQRCDNYKFKKLF